MRLLTGEWPAGPGPGSEASTRRVGPAVAHGSHSLRSRVWPEDQNAAIQSRNESERQSREGSTEMSRWWALLPAAWPAPALPPGAGPGRPHQLWAPGRGVPPVPWGEAELGGCHQFRLLGPGLDKDFPCGGNKEVFAV